jgi:hypothetical protein
VWAASVIMVIVAIGLLVLFRRKRYLSSRR